MLWITELSFTCMVIDKLPIQPSPGPHLITLKMYTVFSTESPNKRNKHKVYSQRNNHDWKKKIADRFWKLCFIILFSVLHFIIIININNNNKSNKSSSSSNNSNNNSNNTSVWTLLQKPFPVLTAKPMLTYADACWRTTTLQLPKFAARSGTTSPVWVRCLIYLNNICLVLSAV